MSPSADLELARAVSAGDEAAFERMVDGMHRSLMRVAMARGPRQVADDVVQETWVRVAGAIGTFEGRSSLRTWVTRILLNVLSERTAKDARFVPLDDGDDGEAGPPPVIDPGAGPEAALLRKQWGRYLAEALAGLAEVPAAVVTLRDVEEWSSEEVCNALGLSESNQRVILHRARQKLRAALASRLAVDEVRG